MINERFELTTALLSLSHQNTEGEMDVARNFYKGVDLTIWVIGWLLCLPLRIVHSSLRSISPKLVSSFQSKRIGLSPVDQEAKQRLKDAVKDTKAATDRIVKEKTRADNLDSQCKTLREENQTQSQRIKQLEKSLHKKNVQSNTNHERVESLSRENAGNPNHQRVNMIQQDTPKAENKSLRKDVKDRDVSMNDLQNEKDRITAEAKGVRKKECESRKQMEALKKERDDKQNQLRQSDDQVTKLKESLRKKESDSRKQIEALRKERDDKQNRLSQSGDQITKLKESLRKIESDSRKQIEVLKEDRDDIRNQLSQSEDQLTKLKESLRNKECDLRKQTEALIKERHDKQNQLRQSDDQITKKKESLQKDDDKCSKQAQIELLSRENDGIRKNLKKTQDQLVKFKEQSESLCQEVKTKDDLIQSLREERDHAASVLKGAEKEVAIFKNQIASLHEELSKHESVMQENGQLWVVLNEKEQIIEEHKMALKDAEDAKEDALRRFSQSVPLRLRDNNPNIADLSDQYRPSKLSNMMSELYVNQWTDAFTYLRNNWENGKTLSETECIKFLLNVLMEIYKFCQSKLTNDWTDGLSKILLTAGLNDETEVLWTLKDIRKRNALTQLANFEKLCITFLLNMEISDDSSFSKHLLQDKLFKYIQECVKLCLLMAVQDPPVCLVCEGWKTRQTNTGDNSSHPAHSASDVIQNESIEERREFNRDSYKEYTKRGQFIQYIVWPLIYLHENGPLLSKGVAQGCDTSTIPSREVL